jgi:hypothetical protein
MRFCSVFLISGALFLLPFHPDAAEYGGGWGEGSIRTHSLQYIEETKTRFDLRAARIAEVIDFEVPLKYRETSDSQKEVYEKLTDEQKKAIPIIGNGLVFAHREPDQKVSESVDLTDQEADDLPF